MERLRDRVGPCEAGRGVRRIRQLRLRRGELLRGLRSLQQRRHHRGHARLLRLRVVHRRRPVSREGVVRWEPLPGVPLEPQLPRVPTALRPADSEGLRHLRVWTAERVRGLRRRRLPAQPVLSTRVPRGVVLRAAVRSRGVRGEPRRVSDVVFLAAELRLLRRDEVRLHRLELALRTVVHARGRAVGGALQGPVTRVLFAP